MHNNSQKTEPPPYTLFFEGCKVLVASRKIDEHQVTINRMKSLLSDPEQLKTTQCNIRKEEEVSFITSPTPPLLCFGSTVFFETFQTNDISNVCRLRR